MDHYSNAGVCDIITTPASCGPGEAKWCVAASSRLYILYIFTRLFSHQPQSVSVLHGASSVSASARPSSASQIVPKFDERFSVLPDQLVTEQDVPAGGEREQRA